MKGPSPVHKFMDLCGSMRLNVWLLLLASLNLFIGAVYTNFNFQLFAPFSNLTIQDWLELHAHAYPEQIWWIFTLIGLFAMLGFNTAVCILREGSDLWARRKQLGWRLFSVRICPALIHLCFLVILTGHGASLVTGFRQTADIAPGGKLSLPDGTEVAMVNSNTQLYEEEALKGMTKKSTGVLSFRNGETTATRRIGVLNPVFWNGYSIHLFMSKRQTGPGQNARMTLIVKKEPAVAVILWTFGFMIAVMLWYYLNETKILRRLA